MILWWSVQICHLVQSSLLRRVLMSSIIEKMTNLLQTVASSIFCFSWHWFVLGGWKIRERVRETAYHSPLSFQSFTKYPLLQILRTELRARTALAQKYLRMEGCYISSMTRATEDQKVLIVCICGMYLKREERNERRLVCILWAACLIQQPQAETTIDREESVNPLMSRSNPSPS